MRHVAIILLSLVCLLMGCQNDRTVSSPQVERVDSASIYQGMAYRAMLADSLTQAEHYAYRSLVLSTDSCFEMGAVSLLCYIYYREGKQQRLELMLQMLSPQAYMNIMDIQMQVEQQKASHQQQYYALAIIFLLFLSGGVALWYIDRIRSLRTLYQQRIDLTRQLLGDHEIGKSHAEWSENRNSPDIAETKLGFDVLYAIINDQNISQMGKHEEQALLKVLPMVDANLSAILANASASLTPKETFFCLMEYYGKSDRQKAHSFCCSDQAIRSTKSRLNKKLDIEQLRLI